MTLSILDSSEGTVSKVGFFLHNIPIDFQAWKYEHETFLTLIIFLWILIIILLFLNKYLMTDFFFFLQKKI